MKGIVLLAIVFLACAHTSMADHITGGEVYYRFKDKIGDKYNYNVTVRLFMLCVSERQFDNPAIISIFSQSSGERVGDYSVGLVGTEMMNLTENNPCITNPPPVCFRIGTYHFTASLPASNEGYIITAQIVYRVDGMNNLTPGYGQVGATYTAVIPANTAANEAENSSAQFKGTDLVIICANNKFSYDFSATDPDNDELRYSFCNAYRTSGGITPGNPSPPPSPPYLSVPYGQGFTGNMPLGNQTTIDAKTGIINGIAPHEGTYVVTVCVEEVRNGKVIAVQRKDLQINVAPCDVAAASLPPEYILCDNSTVLNAKNLSTSRLINNYSWAILDDDRNEIYTSSQPAISQDLTPGTYTLRLVINEGQPCYDSTEAAVRVYPGFKPDFSVSGTCITHAVQFTDGTTNLYGEVNSWLWDFGESNKLDDHSNIASPEYQYSLTGIKPVTLVVESSVGCRDTITKSITVFDKPPLGLSFRDTLICPPDALQLNATGSGDISWTPSPSLDNPTSAMPNVSPTTTTKYFVRLEDDGCINTDSVNVRVVDHVSLLTMPDTVICEGDEAQLSVASDALKFSWTPPELLSNDSVSNPIAYPTGNTVFQVVGSISGCRTSALIGVNTVPYPTANAGPDTVICFNTPASLHAATDGSRFLWVENTGLQDLNSLSPIARPVATSSYIFQAFDTRGCPKPGIDTVLVTVLEKVVPSAGNDTTVVVGQPLQMKASGGTVYTWIPAAHLSAADVDNPVAIFTTIEENNIYSFKVLVSNQAGCTDSANVSVQVFATLPDIFVPNAFTPNGDGVNDYFRPVSAGIRRLESFKIFNRWGQLVYDNTGIHSVGWNGTYKGELLPGATFVWVLKAKDYNGQPVIKKGTVTLIR